MTVLRFGCSPNGLTLALAANSSAHAPVALTIIGAEKIFRQSVHATRPFPSMVVRLVKIKSGPHFS